MDSELVTVDIHINTNATEEERKHLYVPEEAIISFVGEGFQNNLYQGRVLHECMPRACLKNKSCTKHIFPRPFS